MDIKIIPSVTDFVNAHKVAPAIITEITALLIPDGK
jgi:hypothetical protein